MFDVGCSEKGFWWGMMMGIDDGVVEEVEVTVVCVVGDVGGCGFGVGVWVLFAGRLTGFICFGSTEKLESERTYLSGVRSVRLLMMWSASM